MAKHVRVDADACQGHGLCYFASDRLFVLDDSDGKARVLIDPLPEDLEDDALDAVETCPEQAITIVDDAA
ncbi:MAG: ferredoxin [Bauldia sp.]|uniref:ferredoxin n=1 Tax=Bauldia sp. TaxID=2575872 RepID=UPI001E18D751|nr:ferredoxin [Bauldia sp.]MCB1486776.1 ferredoxin [Bauldia sp.]MCB1497944.1 ferredoxin [Bauldia sp.]